MTNELKMKRVFRDVKTGQELLEDSAGRLYRRALAVEEVDLNVNVVWFRETYGAKDGSRWWCFLTDAEVAQVSDPEKASVPVPDPDVGKCCYQVPAPASEAAILFCDRLIDHFANLVKSSQSEELSWITSHIAALGRVKQCLVSLASQEKPK